MLTTALVAIASSLCFDESVTANDALQMLHGQVLVHKSFCLIPH